MNFASRKAVNMYEQAINLSDEIEEKVSIEGRQEPNYEDMAFNGFFNKLLTKAKVNLKDYFTNEDVELFKKLKINLRYEKVHTLFEITSLMSDIMMYIPQAPEKVAEVPLPTDVSKEEVTRLYLQTMKITMENEN